LAQLATHVCSIKPLERRASNGILLGSGIFKKASAVKDRSLVETGSLRFMEGGGEMEERSREFNWEATPLGPLEGWPQALKTLVNLMLASKQPMFLAWGPQRTWPYNDAFTPILGRKHPSALGQPSMQVWAGAREVREPMFDRVFAGEPVSIEEFSLGLDRKGRVEEAHFEFAYTPREVTTARLRACSVRVSKPPAAFWRSGS
jgi:hypothetical protein